MDTNISVKISNTQTFTYLSCHLTTQWYHVQAIFYREGVTFKGLCCSGCMIFVWMELQRKFPVGFLELFITNFFVDTQHFIVILTPLYSEGRKKKNQWSMLFTDLKIQIFMQTTDIFFLHLRHTLFSETNWIYIAPIHEKSCGGRKNRAAFKALWLIVNDYFKNVK